MSTNFLRILRDMEEADKALVDLKVRFSGLSINPAGGLAMLQREGSDWSGFRDQVQAAMAHRAAVYTEAQRIVAELPEELATGLNTQAVIRDINNPMFTDEWEVEKEQRLLKRIEAMI